MSTVLPENHFRLRTVVKDCQEALRASGNSDNSSARAASVIAVGVSINTVAPAMVGQVTTQTAPAGVVRKR